MLRLVSRTVTVCASSNTCTSPARISGARNWRSRSPNERRTGAGRRAGAATGAGGAPARRTCAHRASAPWRAASSQLRERRVRHAGQQEGEPQDTSPSAIASVASAIAQSGIRLASERMPAAMPAPMRRKLALPVAAPLADASGRRRRAARSAPPRRAASPGSGPRSRARCRDTSARPPARAGRDPAASARGCRRTGRRRSPRCGTRWSGSAAPRTMSCPRAC